MRAVRDDDRPRVAADDVASHDAGLLVDRATGVDALLATPGFARVGRAVVVDGSRRPVGIVSATDIERRLRAAAM